MQRDSVWQAVLGEIELSLSRGNFVTWFKNTRLLSHDQQSIVIGVPNVFIKQQLERKYSDLIQELLAKNDMRADTIEFKITTFPSSPKDEVPVALLEDNEQFQSMPTTLQRPVPASSLTHSYRQGINERYTFDNFIVGAGNELAFAACQSIAQLPGRKYNPLFLYGGVGIDKPPKDIPTLEERLQSRFAWGMSIDMQIPDFETRCAIIQTKAAGHGVILPADVVDYLANNIQTNIRELEVSFKPAAGVL
ncbi:unnamed protein product [Sphagnum compactum]